MKEKNLLGLAFIALFIILALLTNTITLSLIGAAVYTFAIWWFTLLFHGDNNHAVGK